MAVTRANVEATKAFIRARLGNPYVYGGALSNNTRQGTDCSEVWQTVLEMVHGRWVQGRQSEGATTESYRYIPVGGTGPFGTIRVAHYRDIPANAAAKLAFHHGPGGGANSHMWGELDGMLIESGGSKGLVTAPRALTIENSYGHAWAYLPGPILNDGTPIPPPPPEHVLLGRRFESTGDRVRKLQEALIREGAQIVADGEFGPMTEAAVTAFQRRTPGLEIDGVAGPLTLAALGITFATTTPAPSTASDGLTVEVLARVMNYRVSMERYAALHPYVLRCLSLSQANTIERRAMWFSQVGHESGGLKWQKEIWGPTAAQLTYQGRMGNVYPGDGERFQGRDFIQITGRDNYTALSRWAYSVGLVPTPTYFVDNPSTLATDLRAFVGVTWYWTVARNMNAFADSRDLVGATRAVNGGTNGLDDRRSFYTRALAEGANLLNPTNIDPFEEMLMLDLESWSIYATPGEPKIPAEKMLQAIDAYIHRTLTDEDAKAGDLEAIRRISRTAAGLGKDKRPGAIAHAIKELNEIHAANPEWIEAAKLKGA